MIALITLSQVCRFAVRRGWLADNPVAQARTRPRSHTGHPSRSPSSNSTNSASCSTTPARTGGLFEFLAYTGLRIGEALGLTWADIDHAGRA